MVTKKFPEKYSSIREINKLNQSQPNVYEVVCVLSMIRSTHYNIVYEIDRIEKCAH